METSGSLPTLFFWERIALNEWPALLSLPFLVSLLCPHRVQTDGVGVGVGVGNALLHLEGTFVNLGRVRC